MKYLFLFALTFFSIQSFSQELDPGDKAALKAIYTSMNGNRWYPNQPNFDMPTDAFLCGVGGVSCENGRITALDLINNNLGGTIPVEIGNLTALKSLKMGVDPSVNNNVPSGWEQEITGIIPKEIGNLKTLETLILSGIEFEGTIPTEIWQLSKLRHLDLHFIENVTGFPVLAKLTGQIPPEIANLTQLEYLDLSHLSLSGPIPPSIASLTNLKHLDLRNQSLSGTIPDLTGIPVSAYVNISGNKFSFAGITSNVAILDVYSPQQQFNMVIGVPLSDRSGSEGLMSADYGFRNLWNNTYHWYEDNKLQVSGQTRGFESFYASKLNSTYYVEITNSLAPNLRLRSYSYTVTSLPVTLVSFDGKESGTHNLLTWQTASETNNAGFEIERSADARTFEKIGFVDGNGDSKETNNYHFTDQNPFATTYYRLKQLDHDGKFEYSSIISVSNASREISVYPNPAKDEIFVKGADDNEEVSLTNATGKSLGKWKMSPAKSIQIKSFESGWYILKIGSHTARKVLIER